MTEPRLRYGFCGSPPFATDVLAALIEGGRPPAIVVTAPARRAGRGRKDVPSPVVELASAHGIDVRRPESAKDQGLKDELRALDLDVLLVASYGELLDQAFLDLPRRFCLNVHGSLLPRWRGASPVQAAIAAGDTVTGVSIQRVVKKLDAGDLLLSIETPIDPADTGGTLFARLAALGGEAARRALDLVEAGAVEFTPQDTERVTHCRKLTKESGHIDWTRPAVEIERLVRAMDPWPGAATTLPNGERLVVWRATVDPDGTSTTVATTGAAPGTVRTRSEGFDVATGAGALRVLELQAAGKKRLPVADFQRGARLEDGVRLGAPTDTGPNGAPTPAH
ncbi:Methionyl-tRNA formyltransferase [Planctomycetes bacterium Pla163]|uniref:Methionyl-tRNA formyltransferase n=1 Tax=Rohdeia mirabilis TaxID=2528008 RepID=A0A518CUN4_9BACT|nr:Methionyl-tRNA formyltransferase [Planctomycetes bacterium Pla163]